MQIRMMALAAVALGSSAVASAHADDFKASCAALGQGFSGSGRVVTAEFVAAGGVQLAPPAPAGPAPRIATRGCCRSCCGWAVSAVVSINVAAILSGRPEGRP